MMEKKIALVLLAAGDSRRFGSNKLLSSFNGKPMYRCLTDQLAQLSESLFARKILVTQYEEIAVDLGRQGYVVVRNTQSERGISHSIHLALENLPDEIDAVCFSVCDQPWLQGSTIEALLRGWQTSGRGIGCLSCQGRTGNPVVFSRKYFSQLLSLIGDVGGKVVMKKHLEDVFFYKINNKKELLDIDKNTCHKDMDSL